MGVQEKGIVQNIRIHTVCTGIVVVYNKRRDVQQASFVLSLQYQVDYKKRLKKTTLSKKWGGTLK